jgi:RNase P/RNase MRP subunit p29
MLSEETTPILPSQNAEQLQAKIERLMDNIVNFSKMKKETEIDVKKRILEIIGDGERLKIDGEELVRMIHEGLHTRGTRTAKICASYIRGLLPPELRPAMRKIVKKEQENEIELLRKERERMKEQ